MKAENEDQHVYTIWQAKGIDYNQENAHRYWMQLYQNFNPLNYLNSHQQVEIIQDLSDTIQFYGNLPKLVNDKIFRLVDREQYFLLKECRLPTSQELICHQAQKKEDARWHSQKYKLFRRKIDEQAKQIAENGYYINTNQQSRKKSFGIYQIEYQHGQEIQRYSENIQNSIIVEFKPFKTQDLNNFQIVIVIQSNLSSDQVPFHNLFPDIQQIKRSLLEVPSNSKFKFQDKANYILYNYQQSKQKRYYQCKEPHFALAFQGGGVKGVSYVGVYNQIMHLQRSIIQKSREANEDIALPIKSVIGSSAGGILALAFTTDIGKDQMSQLCLMMDTFVQDLLIQTEQQGRRAESIPNQQFNNKNITPVKTGYFSNQVDNLKNVIHDLGLVEDSLFDMLIQTLKEPSIQDKLVKILTLLGGSSISSLITFKKEKQKRGDEWVCCCCGCACCCCTNTVNNIKSINYYGILYMALMSGQALQNVVAYLLVLYLKRAVKLSSSIDFKNKFEILIKRKNFSGIQTIKDVKNQAQEVLNSYRSFQVRKREAKDKGKRILKSQMVYTTLPLMKFAKTITMEQYYSLTQIEFTCTSVDLVDYVQRFFNHKTTPKLPVCKAVQMTGSFPLAFQSQKWKRQWGYYYVTYEKTRKQIDLTDHNFTDGGLLANFPIRFIDNQKIRPMYFSHKLNKETVLYGFGLEQLPDFPENIPQKQINDAIKSFKRQFLMRIAPKLFKYLLCCSQHRYYEDTKFELIQFLLSLVSAMKLSDKRLNLQCFQPEIIKTRMPIQSEILLDRKNYLKKLQVTERAVEKFKKVVEEHFARPPHQFIKNELQSLKLLIQQAQKTQGQAISTFKKIVECQFGQHGIFSSVLNQYNKILNNKKVCYKFKNNAGLLLTNQFKNDLNMFIQSFKRESINNNDLDRKPLKQNFNQWLQSVESSIAEIRTNLNNNKGDILEKLVFISEQNLTRQVISRYRFTPFLNQYHKEILGENLGVSALKKLSLNSYVEHQTYKKINKISKRVEKIINQSIDVQLKQAKQKGISLEQVDIKLHVILQSFAISHYYYPQTMEIVQTVLFQINNQRTQQYQQQGLVWKKLSVDILTCTDYRAIYGVFYALGMKTDQIKKKMSQISSLFQIKKNLHEQFKSQIWHKTSLSKLQFLIKRQWEQRFDIIQHIQEQQRLNSQKFKGQLNNCEVNEHSVIKHRISQNQIQTYLQKILDYVSASYQELNKLQVSKRKDRIAQLLNLNHYKEKHQQFQKKGRRVLLNIMTHLSDLCIVICQYIMKTEQYLSLGEISPDDDTFFKGMVLQSMVSTLQYKKYIYTLLKQKAIDPSITIQKFYHLADRKVLLNFTCIKTNQGRFSFVNKNSKPNMPLWAALMAAASLPYMQGSFSSRQQWQNDQSIKDLNQNLANKYFNKITKQDENSHLISFISANFMSSLPIELLSNNRVIQDKLLFEKCHEKNKIIELCFSFETRDQKKQSFDFKQLVSKLCEAMKGRTKFFNCWEFCNYFCEFICSFGCSLEGVGWYFSDLLNQMQLMKLINLRVNSNDNFIYHIYKNYLIKLPLRIGTLEFDKITNDKPYLKDTIRQAEQVVRQLTDIVILKKGRIQYQQFAKNTTLEISYVSTPKQNFYRIKFISFTIWRTLKAKYAIFYKIDNQPTYTRVQYDYIDVPTKIAQNAQKFIYLKYIYCSPRYKIKSRIHKVQLSSLAFPTGKQYQKQLKFLRAIFRFPYRNVLINDDQNRLQGLWDGVQLEKSDKQISGVKSQRQLLMDSKYQTPQLILITEIQNRKGSMFCTNPKCLPRKLNILLYSERRREQCFTCSSASNVIAMNCTTYSCRAKYCFRCKIQNFIGIQKDPKQSTYERCCTKGHKLALKSNQNSQLCLYCDKYSLSLWKDEKCDLALCSNCLIYIPQVQIQDTIENDNSQQN